ncbi:MAG TPA: sel1 repeat family protein, partial [Epsilonproteobacteria bacterium]|nr:sel1 repeat family protein [Campylobacterota bacterium]
MTQKAQEAYNHLLNKTYDKAFVLYSELAAQNDPVAHYYLGFLYFRGFGVDQDSKKAFEHYLEAATREVPLAQFDVALMPENGEGCEQNFSEAAFWY